MDNMTESEFKRIGEKVNILQGKFKAQGTDSKSIKRLWLCDCYNRMETY